VHWPLMSPQRRIKLRLGKKFLFLENFSADAEDFWRENDQIRTEIGAGVKLTDQVNECHLWNLSKTRNTIDFC